MAELDENVAEQEESLDVDNDEETRVEDEEEEEELSEQEIAELRSLIKKVGTEEMANRRQELLRAREARFFWRDYQYPMFNSDQGAWAVPENGGFPFTGAGEGSGGANRFFYVTNIYTQYGKTLISSLVGSTPPVRFFPCDPFEIKDVDSAKECEKYRRVFYQAVDIGQVLRDLGRYFYTDGRTVGWVKQVTDKRFGVDRDGNPKTQEIVELYGVLEAKVPIALRHQSKFPYIQISVEENVAEQKEKYPDKADKIKENVTGPGEDAFDRQCRLATLQGSEREGEGSSYAHLATVQNTWFRKFAFNLIKNKPVRKSLSEKFPNGVRVTYVGETFCEAVEECMDDVLEVVLPQPGDGQAVSALGRPLIPVQKQLNNLTNLVQEAYEKGSPQKFVDSKAIDTDAMADQVASPESYMPVKRPPNTPMGDLFYKEPPQSQAPDLVGRINELKGATAQFVSGAQPALFGGPMTNSKTAAVYAQARDQAMGALSITYGPLKTFLARIVEMAVRLAENREANDINSITPNGKGGYSNTKVSMDTLKLGNYLCKPEVDEGIPESFSAKKATFTQLIQFMGPNPQFQSLIMHPDNQWMFKELTGIKEFEIPGADSRDKQLREIDELLEGQPENPTPEDIQKVAQHQSLLQTAGQPAPVVKPQDMQESSVPIDPDFDDHKTEYLECVRWINSQEGQQAKVFNPKGFENVRLHALAHKRAMTAGPAAGAPLQDQIPNPQQVMQAAAAKAAMQAHAAEGAAPPQGEVPPPAGGAGAQ